MRQGQSRTRLFSPGTVRNEIQAGKGDGTWSGNFFTFSTSTFHTSWFGWNLLLSDTAVNTPELVIVRSTLGGAALAQSPHFADEKMGSGSAGTGMQEQESQKVSILVTFLMSIYTEYSTYTSRGLCGGECCHWKQPQSCRTGVVGEKCFVRGAGAHWQWVVAAESGVCQVNDTSADFG